MSLFSGSVLVLLTLFLPIAYQSCGPPETGYEFVREDKGDWPSFLALTFHTFHEAGRGFYILSLALAALTILVLLALRRPDLLRKQRLMTGLFVIAGSIFLFAVLDLFCLEVGLVVDWLTGGGVDIYPPVWGGLLIAFILLSCFGSALARRRKGLVVWIITLTSGIALSLTLRSLPDLLAMLPWLIFSLLPLAIWYRFRFSRRDEIKAQWPRIRRRLIASYIPAVLVDFDAAVSGDVWGLLPYFIGISLIALGYMQLVRQAALVTAPANLGSGTGDNALVPPRGFNYLAGDQD